MDNPLRDVSITSPIFTIPSAVVDNARRLMPTSGRTDKTCFIIGSDSVLISCAGVSPSMWLAAVFFPNIYPGTLSAIIALISDPYFLLISVGITVSPGIRSANSVSLFPVPPTVIGFPFALFVGAIEALIIPGFIDANLAPAAVAC